VAEEKGKWTTTTAFALSPDGALLATCDPAGAVALWDLPKRKKFFQWEFPGPVYGVCFDPRGARLATGNGNGTVTILKVPPR
jgi:WD40 repeat protein